MSKRFILVLVIGLMVFGLAILAKESPWTAGLLWEASRQGSFLLPLVAVAALVDSINPCAFSILLVTIAVLFALGQAKGKILRTGVVYILGLFSVYIAIGLGILGTLHLFNTPHFMAKVGAVILIILGGINLINEFFPAFPLKLKVPHAAHHKMAELMERGSLPAAFLLGIIVGLCEFPCTGGPYLMILGLLHDRQTYFSGLFYLVFYNLIFVLPLVVILLAASDEVLLKKVQAWQKRDRRMLRILGGLAMVGLGVLIFFL